LNQEVMSIEKEPGYMQKLFNGVFALAN